MKMTQTYKGDRALPITPIKIVRADEGVSFSEGELLAVRGKTKGKGFAGVVKRYSFSGGPKTHGQKNRHRAPGSIGNTTPQRVLPGRRMAGHMGAAWRTIKNLEVVSFDSESKILALKGAVPGSIKGKIEIKKLS